MNARLPWSVLSTWLASAVLLLLAHGGEHSLLALSCVPWIAWALLAPLGSATGSATGSALHAAPAARPASQPLTARVAALALPLLGLAAGLDLARGLEALTLARLLATLAAAWWLLRMGRAHPLSQGLRGALVALVLVAWIVPVLGAENFPQAPLLLDALARLSPLDFALRAPGNGLSSLWPLVGALLVRAAGALAPVPPEARA